MRQTASFISTYAADVSGVCSALFELGGMTVMHDASGCNSTYNTHDEPRWYDMDSMVYISGLAEIEAVMGDDDKLINDIVSAAEELSPKFIAVAGTPIPMIMGTDFKAVAAVVERRTGIPAFGFPTNGMHSYLSGAGMAFKALAERMTDRTVPRDAGIGVNILGATPLDFSINGTVDSIRHWLSGAGFRIVGTWAMGSGLDEIAQAGRASVNLVVSYCGLEAAKTLHRLFRTPYVVGLPVGRAFSEYLLKDIETAAKTGVSHVSCTVRATSGTPDGVIIGESVISGSLAAAAALDHGLNLRVLCPLETEDSLLSEGDCLAMDEDDLVPQLAGIKTIVADPLYKPLCPGGCRFVALPHEAFSGRIFRKDIPDLTTGPIEF